MLFIDLLLALLSRLERLRQRLRAALGLPARLPSVHVASRGVPPLPGPPSMTSSQMLLRAFGAARAARYEADATVLGEAFPAPDVPALAAALLPDNWGSVRDVFGVLKKKGEGGLAAVPTLAAWLLVAPTRVGKAQGYLTGWEAYALAEAWYALGALNKELRRVVDRTGEGPVGAALAGLVELCDGAMVEEAARVLAGPDGHAQRGAVDFLGTAVGAAERARSALLGFARTPAPEGEAGLGYARGEAIRAWSGLERFAPAAPRAGVAGAAEAPIATEPPPADSWAGRLAAFRTLLAQPDLGPAREVARELLLAGPPPTAAGMELRAAAVGLLARPVPAPEGRGSAGAEGALPAHGGRADGDRAEHNGAEHNGADSDRAEGDGAEGDRAQDSGADRDRAEDSGAESDRSAAARPARAREDVDPLDPAREDSDPLHATRGAPTHGSPTAADPTLAGQAHLRRADDLLARGPRVTPPESAPPGATAPSSPSAPVGSSPSPSLRAVTRAFHHLCALAAPGQPAEVRVSALESLTRRFPTDEEVLDLLCFAAEDDDATLRLAAARLLGEL